MNAGMIAEIQPDARPKSKWRYRAFCASMVVIIAAVGFVDIRDGLSLGEAFPAYQMSAIKLQCDADHYYGRYMDHQTKPWRRYYIWTACWDRQKSAWVMHEELIPTTFDCDPDKMASPADAPCRPPMQTEAR